MRFAVLVLLAIPLPAHAGLHFSGQPQNDLPANWRGFLPDHRSLRLLAAPQAATPLADHYSDALLRLEPLARAGAATPDQLADLGAVYVRLGKPEKAVELLRPARRKFPDHFALAANLGTAWQLAGDLEQAAASLEDAVRLAPPKWKPAEAAHLKLVQLRRKEGKTPADRPDALAADAALAQQLAIWLPADGRLLWRLAEIAHDSGDVTTAAAILDGCVTEFGMKSEELRRRRQKYRAAADDLAKKEDHAEHRGALAFKSARPLVSTFDPAKLPAIRPNGVTPLPWAALGETALGKKFPPTFLKHVEQLDGKRVAVIGFMRPTADGAAEGGAFLLTEFPVGCWFCESPPPTGVLSVELAAGKTAEFTRAAVKIEGTLVLNKTDPESYLFTLTGAKLGAAD